MKLYFKRSSDIWWPSVSRHTQMFKWHRLFLKHLLIFSPFKFRHIYGWIIFDSVNVCLTLRASLALYIPVSVTMATAHILPFPAAFLPDETQIHHNNPLLNINISAFYFIYRLVL